MLPKILIVTAIAVLGLFGFFLLNRPNNTAPVVQEKQSQPLQGGHGSKESFYNKDGIALQHYWPGEESFSNEETEILLFNESGSNLEVKSFNLDYSVEGKTYPHKSGTWEKFPTIESWERNEYIMISPQYYKGEQLLIAPNQKGKLHWHINFGPNPLDGKQTVHVKLTLLKGNEILNIDEQFNRDSGTVVSKAEH